MALALAQAGLTCIEFKQQPSTYAEPMRLFERCVKSGRIVHGGHPVLTWNAGNVSVYRDGNDNMKPMKNKSTGRIDGIVAAVMALGLLTLNAPAPTEDIESAYAPGEGFSV
jgi:phage terminase large subunit-like protein